ncbi:MAG TPA: hypothetical protein VHL54_00875, partial [Actinomycetota bacterium]|nr:hypothetical protein [Actinomycetota bacterium]
MDAGALLECPADELAEALTRFEAGRCAVHQAELDLIHTFDERCHFALDGCANMATWLSLKFGWSYHRASETV